MPPSLRRRGQAAQHRSRESLTDSDGDHEIPAEWNEEDQPEEMLSGPEEDGELEEGEEEEGAEEDEDMGPGTRFPAYYPSTPHLQN